MAVPVAGQIIRASDVLTFEDAKPRCHAYDAATVSCVSGTSTLITFDSEMYDSTGTMHTGGNPSRLIAPIDGLYRYRSQIIIAAVTTYTVGLFNVRQNAAGAAGGGTSLQNTNFVTAAAVTNVSPRTEFIRALVAGDYLETFIQQTSGGSNRSTIAGAYSTFATLEYVASS